MSRYRFEPRRLKAARDVAGLTQEGLARKLQEITVRTITRWESGEGEGPKGAQLVALADALEISPESLYVEGGDEEWVAA
jgi:transcriptional regulator with XRE-family HTH domain